MGNKFLYEESEELSEEKLEEIKNRIEKEANVKVTFIKQILSYEDCHWRIKCFINEDIFCTFVAYKKEDVFEENFKEMIRKLKSYIRKLERIKRGKMVWKKQ